MPHRQKPSRFESHRCARSPKRKLLSQSTALMKSRPNPIVQKPRRQKRHIHRQKQIPLESRMDKRRLNTSQRPTPGMNIANKRSHGFKLWVARPRMFTSAHSLRSLVTACSTSGFPPVSSNALSRPIRELLPPASTYPPTGGKSSRTIKHPRHSKTAQSTQSPDKNSPDETSHSEHADCHPAVQTPSSP